MILTIDRNTFIWVKNKEGYVYNTSNYQSFKFSCDKHINHVIKLRKKNASERELEEALFTTYEHAVGL